MNTGVKTRAGLIGVGPAAFRRDCAAARGAELATVADAAVATFDGQRLHRYRLLDDAGTLEDLGSLDAAGPIRGGVPGSRPRLYET